MIDLAITDIEPLIGTLPACRALGASRAGVYCRRRPPRARQPCRCPSPARALSEPERTAVLEQLHCERFLDSSPAQVWATLLDEGRYLGSERTMYRLLTAEGPVRDRRDQLTHPSYAGAARRATERGVELGHHQTARPAEVDVLLSVRHPRRGEDALLERSQLGSGF
jgi:hypothetical protein